MRSPFDDLCIPTLAILMLGGLGWTMPLPEIRGTEPRGDVTDSRVTTIAEAIAKAEGYYAPGVHAGRSLPYRLNNPGALKKPALNAASLPTWEETGLIHFPSSEMGWEALRHQVRLMLTGGSRVYEREDSLLHVADKYADGDLNWGVSVAERLGVSPCATLADLGRSPRAETTWTPQLAARASALLLARTQGQR